MSKQKKASKQGKVNAPFNPSKTRIDAEVAVPSIGATTSFWQQQKWAIAVIVLFSIALYVRGVTYEYVLDDKIVISNNEFTQKGVSGIADIFRYESFRGYFKSQKNYLEGDRYRPMSIATFAVEQTLFRGSPLVSHWLNILLYAFGGVLLLRVLLLFFEQNTLSAKWYWSVPFATTLLYLAHPLHVEVVANIKGRDEILTLIGELSAMYCAWRYCEQRDSRWLGGVFMAFTVAIFSKESAITFVAVLPLTLYFFQPQSTFAQRWQVAAVAMLATALYLSARYQAIGYFLSPDGGAVQDVMNNPFAEMSIAERYATIVYTMGWYLKLHVLPHPLTHDYYPYHVGKMQWSDALVWVSVLAYAALAVVLWRGWRSRTVWAYSVAFFLLTMSIVSNVAVSVGTFMNERFAFHASVAFCLVLAYFLVKKLAYKHLGMALTALVLFAYSFKTVTRVADWHDEQTLNRSAIAVSPNSARANLFYGIDIWKNQYLPDSAAAPARRRQLLDTMRPYFQRAIDIYPHYNSGFRMYALVMGEYWKLDRQLTPLLTAFDRINRNQNRGIEEPYVRSFVAYVARNLNDANQLAEMSAFLTRMVTLYHTERADENAAKAYEAILATLPMK
jgi:protein O-mannosyl-transferase